jgi:hypothetical protein
MLENTMTNLERSKNYFKSNEVQDYLEIALNI